MPPRQPARNRTARDEYLLPHAKTAASWARRLTTAFLARDGTAALTPAGADDAALVVSELVTNATLHARSGCRLRLSVAPGGHLTIEVHDDAPTRPRRRSAAASEEHGRGLVIVDALARHLDVLNDPRGGKTVRARLSPA
ncbi:ATP-binding protein [Streptomyces sp. NPDC018019]|uniref:ATP-binding protein n=1 Tax=Streptomyces sp. NPDC018019 TaxID=3365030 RepID=UPI0037B41AD8